MSDPLNWNCYKVQQVRSGNPHQQSYPRLVAVTHHETLSVYIPYFPLARIVPQLSCTSMTIIGHEEEYSMDPVDCATGDQGLLFTQLT